ncbi:MAG: ParB/RepB/Spo0J family partition protein [Flavonifractor plautii]
MAKFDITAAFQAAVGTAGNVSKLDTSREAIEYISLDKLEADPGNFYRLTGLEDLAANIELCGLQQPVRVRPTEGGRYMIVSGHRRRAALALLAKEDPERWAAVPCLVERDEVSPELRELRLILANSSTRVLSPAEVSKQAQRVETLLYQLKEQGYAFPGRMRDQVAAACKVSAPKLARLKVIREHLIPIYLEHFDRNVLSEQTAYALARMETALQERLANMLAEPAHREPGGRTAGVGQGRYKLAAYLLLPRR